MSATTHDTSASSSRTQQACGILILSISSSLDNFLVGASLGISGDAAHLSVSLNAIISFCNALGALSSTPLPATKTFVERGANGTVLSAALADRGGGYAAGSVGARVVAAVLDDPELKAAWLDTLKVMSSRIGDMRTALRAKLDSLDTGRDWSHITSQIGMFSYTGMTKSEVLKIREKHHVYMLESGRISMAGINTKNVDQLATAIADGPAAAVAAHAQEPPRKRQCRSPTRYCSTPTRAPQTRSSTTSNRMRISPPSPNPIIYTAAQQLDFSHF